VIGDRELTQHEADRPTIGRDVVRLDHQEPVISAELEEHRPQHRPAREIESPATLLDDESSKL